MSPSDKSDGASELAPIGGIEPVHPVSRYPFQEFALPVKIHKEDLASFQVICRHKRGNQAGVVADMISFCLRLLADGGTDPKATLIKDLSSKVTGTRTIMRRADLLLCGAEKVLMDSQALLASVRHQLISEAVATGKGCGDTAGAGPEIEVARPVLQPDVRQAPR